MTRALVQLVRPSQWIKNLVVFAALVFGGRLFDPESVVRSVVAFVAFCKIASAAYVVNDLCDVESDRRHPEKRHRPLVAGRVSPGAARVLALALGAGALGLAAAVGPAFAAAVGAYGVLQILYSWKLKHLVIVDVMSIATGFVLRAAGGGIAIGVVVSPWLIICTFLLALFLALQKRRHEIVVREAGAAGHPEALRESTAFPFSIT